MQIHKAPKQIKNHKSRHIIIAWIAEITTRLSFKNKSVTVSKRKDRWPITNSHSIITNKYMLRSPFVHTILPFRSVRLDSALQQEEEEEEEPMCFQDCFPQLPHIQVIEQRNRRFHWHFENWSCETPHQFYDINRSNQRVLTKNQVQRIKFG